MNTENNHGQEPHNEDHKVLKTFDMYSFFSRKDVLLAIGFVLVLMIIFVMRAIFAPQIV